MARVSAQRLAQLGVTVQFLALVRNLAEFHRLRHLLGPALTVSDVAPFVTGSLLTALCTWLAVSCYFLGKYRAATLVAAATVVLLLAYKFIVLG